MWFFTPLMVGSAGTAAMMMFNPFYWGLYLSMGPGGDHKRR
jgi:hypothetical protein